MSHFLPFVFVSLLAAVALLQQGVPPLTQSPWEFRSADGRVSVQLQGKLDVDGAFFDAEEGLEAVTGAWDNGVELRRSRLGVGGHLMNGSNLNFPKMMGG